MAEQSKIEVDTDPFSALKEACRRIELLERQVEMLMQFSDSQLRIASGSENVAHAWPRRDPKGTT